MTTNDNNEATDGRVRNALLLSALLWGTWWIPLREVHGLGFADNTGIALGYGVAIVLLLPWIATRPRMLLACGWLSLVCAACFALSFALWSDGLVHGSVARVTLLFYLAPVWGTVLARLVLKEPITWLRGAAIVLGLGGAVILLGGLEGPPLPQDRAEWFGLIGGVFWALALLFVNLTAGRPDAGRAFLIVLLSAPAYLLLGTGAGDGIAVDWPVALAVLAVFGAVWILPVVWLTLYGASRMDPGRVAIILILEVAVAILSAAILTGEPFGAKEAAGAVAIMAAGVLESLPRLLRRRSLSR